jgi:transcriptional regulator with XRE-family HTH domain
MKLPQLRAVRNRRALTQADLAERAGVGRVTIARIETGAAGAHPSTVRKLAAALGVEPSTLMRAPRSRTTA